MKVTCRVPCGFDPKVIAECMKIAWRIFKLRTKQGPKALPDIRQIKTRKGMNRPWCRRGGAVVWINPRMTRAEHAMCWAVALLEGNDYVVSTLRDDEMDLIRALGADRDEGLPQAPKKVKPTKRELAAVEKLAKARAAIEEWEAKERAAQRALRLARTKLGRYRKQMRALERVVREQAPAQAIGYDPNTFAKHMRERIGGGAS